MSDTNGMRLEVEAAMVETASKVMKPYNAQLAKITNGWKLLAKPNENGAACTRCDVKGHTALLNGICWSCYGKANGCNVDNDSVPSTDPRVPISETAAPQVEARCDFCGRSAEEIAKTGVTVVRGQSGAHLCGSCACAAAGTMGAKSAAEARSMMGLAQFQAEAAKQCLEVLKMAREKLDKPYFSSEDASEYSAYGLYRVAEELSRIAKGQ